MAAGFGRMITDPLIARSGPPRYAHDAGGAPDLTSM